MKLNEHFDSRNTLSLHFVLTLAEIHASSLAQKSEHICHFSSERALQKKWWKFEKSALTDRGTHGMLDLPVVWSIVQGAGE